MSSAIKAALWWLEVASVAFEATVFGYVGWFLAMNGKPLFFIPLTMIFVARRYHFLRRLAANLSVLRVPTGTNRQ